MNHWSAEKRTIVIKFFINTYQIESKEYNNLNYKEIIEARNDFKVEEELLLIEKAFDTESTMVKKEEELNKKVPELAYKATSSIEKSLNPQKTYLKKNLMSMKSSKL